RSPEAAAGDAPAPAAAASPAPASAPARRRVVYLIDKMGLGGAQMHLRGLITKLDRRRFQPTVFCLIQAGDATRGLDEAGVPGHVLGIDRISGAGGLRGLARLVRWLRAERPHVLHAYLSSANVLGALAARAAGVPCLITTRRDTGHGDSPAMRR